MGGGRGTPGGPSLKRLSLLSTPGAACDPEETGGPGVASLTANGGASRDAAHGADQGAAQGEGAVSKMVSKRSEKAHMMGKQTMPVPTTRRGLYLRILMSKRVPVLPQPPYSLGLGCTTTSQTDPPPPRLRLLGCLPTGDRGTSKFKNCHYPQRWDRHGGLVVKASAS